MTLAQKRNGLFSSSPPSLQIISIFLVSALYTGFVLGSAADRLAVSRSEIAQRVPSFFASEALRVGGAQALAAGKAQEMTAFGTQALRDAPTDPQSAAMLGAGLLASGAQVKADQAFRVAGGLGWRVPITQSYWLSKSLADNDYKMASLRLDALLRQQPHLVSQRLLLDPMERNPAGRAALIDRMYLRPEWLPIYTSDVAASPADAMVQRSDLLEEAASKGLILGCDMIAPMIARLTALNLNAAADRLSRAHCSQ